MRPSRVRYRVRESAISVDIHVHRVTNRWGIISAPTPEQTMRQVETKLS